ncbi:hypothetical protein [Lysinibacter cavernae]|uniref:Uncharacterized protein n=1 Tax=Lysinibacter cavernae TaxID=1640652 RepID=A0A7X5R3K1_9MICO|nr:hypothetical protein [Lysinibacter cavernae]NIH55003.1 hypothetical protein [Lysinibacter cavernae]
MSTHIPKPHDPRRGANKQPTEQHAPASSASTEHSQQEHHNPETEEDTASGGPA